MNRHLCRMREMEAAAKRRRRELWWSLAVTVVQVAVGLVLLYLIIKGTAP
jgi:predicted cobalt transporter CbtA